MSESISPQKYYKVAIAFDNTVQVNAEIHKGILAYAQEHPYFKFRYSISTSLEDSKKLKDWDGDGAIVALQTTEQVECITDYTFPIVNVSSAIENSPCPRIRRDHLEVGEKAAEQLFQIGLENYAYIGHKEKWFSQLKLQGMQHFLKTKGFDVQSLFIKPLSSLENEEISLKRVYDWMSHLKYPIGIFIDTDDIFSIILEITNELNLSIPEQVSVISVNNSEVAKVYNPSLSSIGFSNSALGYYAMETLHKQIEKTDASITTDTVLKGIEVHIRDSTNTIFVKDEKLKTAITYMQKHIDRYFSIEEVLAEIETSRRWLEYTFKKELQTTPAKFIKDIRVNKVKFFIDENPFVSIEKLVSQCGFSSDRHLKDVFAQSEKINLDEYREKIAKNP